jgi:peptidoglycan/LPS O-acetylase OafA/YrhL
LLKDGTRAYIAGFDGLRAIAALAVIGFHLRIPGFSLGWFGICLFFVLSGFLITGILLDAKGNSAYFRTFYWRRVLRIFPIYFLGLCVLMAWTALRAREPITDWPWFTFYLQNWLLAQTHFNPNFLRSFDHTWSLACEEQFYLLWPAVIYWSRRKALLYIVIGLILLGPASRALVILETQNSSAVFAPLPCIADMLAWGALAQLVVREVSKTGPFSRIAPGMCIALGTVMMLMAFHRGLSAFWDPDNHLRDLSGGVLFFGLWGPLGATILITVYFGSRLSKALEFPLLRYLGRISYGLYLYHFPILLLLRPRLLALGLDSLTRAAVIFLLTLITSIVSFEFFERLFLRMKERPMQRTQFREVYGNWLIPFGR